MKWGKFYLLILLSIVLSMSLSINSHANNNDKLLTGLIQYQAIEQKHLITGEFNSQGSSRIAPIVNNLLTEFSRIYKKISFTVTTGGSGSAIKGLINKKSHFGLMSRKIKATEMNQFIDEKGYRPTEIRIALDDLRVIVNRKNPIDNLSLQELDAIFSNTRKCGSRYALNTWEELGWAAEKKQLSIIDRHIFNPKSGARGFFKITALCGGDYKKAHNATAITTNDMVKNVANSITAIGFSALDVYDYRVKTLAISRVRSYPTYYPTMENVLNFHYPLSRYLYIYMDKPPTSEMPLFYREFFKFLFSQQGQQIILNHGAIPLRFNVIRDELVNVIGRR